MKIKTKTIANNLIFKLNLILLLILVMIFATSYFVAKNEINQIFDAELKKSGLIIFEITKNHNSIDNSEELEKKLHQKFLNRYDYDILLQIWNKNKLIYSSENNINFAQPTQDGFFDVSDANQDWRAFTYHDKNTNYKIAIYEKYNIRQSLVFEISSVVCLIFALSSFFIISAIIAIVNRELKPIHSLSEKITKLNLSNFRALNHLKYPKEIHSFVTSFNQLMMRLQKVLENEKKFTDYAAHELNTPLTAIRLQAQNLQNNYSKNKDLNFGNLIIAVDRANHLIKQLLILARIESETHKKNFCRLNIIDIIDEVIEDLSHKGERPINFVKKISKSTPEIHFNVHKFFFKILLNNLMENAVKYSINNDPIEIFIQSKNEKLEIKITNSSEKIARDDQAKIFEKFFRANKSTLTRNVEGCGLGLSIARQIIDIHRGQINFTHENQKTSVTIELTNDDKQK